MASTTSFELGSSDAEGRPANPHVVLEQEAGPPGGLRAELDALREEVSRNHREIDDLQVRTAERHQPWHRNSQTLVAVFALLLSLVTTLTSAYWAKTQGDAAEARLRQQEIHDAKIELRGLLQAMAQLTREQQQVPMTGDGYLAQLLLSSYASEISLLTNQAYDVVQDIPDHVSSSEYFNVALRLGELGNFQRAAPLLQRAIDTATTPLDYLNATRTYGMFLFGQGDVENGRWYMRQALGVWQRFQDQEVEKQAPLWPKLEDLITHMRWAELEAGATNCTDAKEQRDQADALRIELGLGPDSPLQQQFDQMSQFVDACVPSESPVIPAMPTFTALFPPSEELAPFFPLETPTPTGSWFFPVETAPPADSSLIPLSPTPFP